jgi:sulfur-oxidizing protein SoxY
MDRRNFLSITLGSLALAAIPASVKAEDFRKSKPAVWSAHTIEDAIANMYGSKKLEMTDEIKLSVANVSSTDTKKKATAANGGAVPVDFKTNANVKNIAVLQDANPESAVMVIDCNEFSVNDYGIKIKMGKPGKVVIVAETTDGRLIGVQQDVDVALGGCEG